MTTKTSEQTEEENKKLRLALRKVRALAKRLRYTDLDNAEHLLRFCDEAGVHDRFLRDQGL